MALTIERHEAHGVVTLAVAGEVDLYSSPALREAVLKAAPKVKAELCIDLSGVPYMDSSGVATLVEGLKASKAKNTEFVLVAPSPPVLKVWQLARLDTIFTIRLAEPEPEA